MANLATFISSERFRADVNTSMSFLKSNYACEKIKLLCEPSRKNLSKLIKKIKKIKRNSTRVTLFFSGVLNIKHIYWSLHDISPFFMQSQSVHYTCILTSSYPRHYSATTSGCGQSLLLDWRSCCRQHSRLSAYGRPNLSLCVWLTQKCVFPG